MTYHLSASKTWSTMGLWKRGKQYWLDAVVPGERYREPLGTTDWRKAKELEKKQLAELLRRPPDRTKRAHKFSALPIERVIDQYAEDRRARVSERMVAWWKENARPLVGFFGDKPLRKVTPADLRAYQNARRDAGRAAKTINGELSVLRQLLKHAKLWYRFAEEYRPLKNTKPPACQAITDEAQAHLFEVAKSRPAWIFAYVAASLDFFCGLRACEIKALQWKHISFDERGLSVRRSKTPAGWRDPSLTIPACFASCNGAGQHWASGILSTSSSRGMAEQKAGSDSADDVMADRVAITAARGGLVSCPVP